MSLHPEVTSNLIKREARTIRLMIELFCRDHHSQDAGICPECAMLSDYAMERPSRCPIAPHKPTCTKCPVHCYKPEMRARVRQVMRYSGPRMLLRHPILTSRHMLDGLRKLPEKKWVSVY